jgi:hypothetical protein
MLPYGGGKGTKQYGWVTGCSSTYTNWASGQPDNGNNINGGGGNQDYAAVYPFNQWFDQGLEYNYNQLQFSCGCEYNPALTTTPSFSPSIGDISE